MSPWLFLSWVVAVAVSAIVITIAIVVAIAAVKSLAAKPKSRKSVKA
jgi:hypothetical protein